MRVGSPSVMWAVGWNAGNQASTFSHSAALLAEILNGAFFLPFKSSLRKKGEGPPFQQEEDSLFPVLLPGSSSHKTSSAALKVRILCV